MGVLSSTSWFIINLFIHLFIFVVLSLIGRKSTTKCMLIPNDKRYIFSQYEPTVWLLLLCYLSSVTSEFDWGAWVVPTASQYIFT
jgi:nucleoside recognition membrane protein YjiH